MRLKLSPGCVDTASMRTARMFLLCLMASPTDNQIHGYRSQPKPQATPNATWRAVQLAVLKQKIRNGTLAMGLSLPAVSIERLADYLALLDKWNRTYNLTAVRDPEQMVYRHVLDSLSVISYLHGRRVLDIGTGAGLPGIPLAVACPEREFVLLDSNAKKIRFVTQAIATLQLPNAQAILGRAEKLETVEKFDTLISRALGGITDMLALSAHLCSPGGHFVAMKGVYPQEELAALPPGYEVLAVEALQVPGLDGKRHAVIISAKASGLPEGKN